MGVFFLIPLALDNCNKNHSGSNECNNYYYFIIIIIFLSSVYSQHSKCS